MDITPETASSSDLHLAHIRGRTTCPKAKNRITVVVHALKLSVLEKNRETVCWPAGS